MLNRLCVMCNEIYEDKEKYCPVCERQTLSMVVVIEEKNKYECSVCSGTGTNSAIFYDCESCNGKGYWTEKEFADQLAKEE